MIHSTRGSISAMRFVPGLVLCLAAATVTAQPAPAMSRAASMPKGQMQMEAKGSASMKEAMASGMEAMQKMSMSGDTDKDFAMMMRMHHQQALQMAETELKHGKSPAMKAMAKRIVLAQKNEIAAFDRWLANHK